SLKQLRERLLADRVRTALKSTRDPIGRCKPSLAGGSFQVPVKLVRQFKNPAHMPMLREQFQDGLARAILERVGYLHRASDGAHVFLLPVDTQRFVDRGVQIAHGHDAARDVVSLFLARSASLAAL